MRSFGSDNHAGVHPLVLQEIANANVGDVHSYGDDPYTEQATQLFKSIFGEEIDVYFVFNGTGANMLSLSACARSFNTVMCAETAHINVDECGAPEHEIGCKLFPIKTADGKLTPELCPIHGVGDQHHSQTSAISIAQPTEMGTIYSLDEIRKLSEYAHSNGLYLHMDGARFANAVDALHVSPREIVQGVDILSFGGTKNGMMIGEAVVVLNQTLRTPSLKYLRKQMMQLGSKMRFIAAQFIAYFKNDLWLKLAHNSNVMAQKLAKGVQPYVKITQSTETNAVFAILPPELVPKLMEKYFFYMWDVESSEVRWMTHFNTTEKDIEDFVLTLKSLFPQ